MHCSYIHQTIALETEIPSESLRYFQIGCIGHSNPIAITPNCLKTKMSVGYLETRLVGNYIQMWQTSERRTPPPLLPLPPLFSALNEISPICGGNSVAHPSQNMSDVIPFTSPGSSPNLLPPPTPLPVSSPEADEGGNGPK